MSSLVKPIGIFIGGIILGVLIGASLPSDNGRYIPYGVPGYTLDTKTGTVYLPNGDPVQK